MYIQNTTKQAQETNYLCPSARCEEGAILLGSLRKDGTIGLLSQRIILDEENVALARSIGEPEKRLRFASACVKSRCQQWTDGKCGVIKNALVELKKNNLSEKPQKCSIREACRWFAQEGISSCKVCTFVITDH